MDRRRALTLTGGALLAAGAFAGCSRATDPAPAAKGKTRVAKSIALMQAEGLIPHSVDPGQVVDAQMAFAS